MKRKIIAGNYKMNKTITEVEEFLNEIKDSINVTDKEVIIFPNNLAVYSAVKLLENTNVKVGIQNISTEDSGAYTGETSAVMAKDALCTYVLCGHSERREKFSETDEIVNKKVLKCLENSLKPVICVGENLLQRQDNFHFVTVKHQVKKALKGVSKEDIENIIIAYEPIWAIGTGESATSKQADEMCKYIKEKLKEEYGEEASKIKVLYGGSVTEKTADELLNMENIDGALIGSASLKKEFVNIVNTKIVD